ncbi:MAG: pentapeptide repeat-containing protein [Pseudomonadota bacterium]
MGFCFDLTGLTRLGSAALISSLAVPAVLLSSAHDSQAAEFTARDVTSALHRSQTGTDEFVDADLSMLDLANLDFKQADLTGADLYGKDLTGANLIGVNLSETRLDRATLVRTNLSEAILDDATLLRPNLFGDLAFSPYDTARFTNASLQRARILGNFNGTSFRGANLTEADFSPLRDKPDTISTLARTQLTGADFTRAVMKKVDFSQALLSFAKFTGADLSGANFRRADLSLADLSGADIAGADFTDAKLEGANLKGVKGLETAIGLTVASSTTQQAEGNIQ